MTEMRRRMPCGICAHHPHHEPCDCGYLRRDVPEPLPDQQVRVAPDGWAWQKLTTYNGEGYWRSPDPAAYPLTDERVRDWPILTAEQPAPAHVHREPGSHEVVIDLSGIDDVHLDYLAGCSDTTGYSPEIRIAVRAAKARAARRGETP